MKSWYPPTSTITNMWAPKTWSWEIHFWQQVVPVGRRLFFWYFPWRIPLFLGGWGEISLEPLTIKFPCKLTGTKNPPKVGMVKKLVNAKLLSFFKDTNCFSGLSTCSCSRFFNHQLIDSLPTPNVKFRSVISPRSGLLVVCNPLTLARDSVSWYLGVHRWWPGC